MSAILESVKENTVRKRKEVSTNRGSRWSVPMLKNIFEGAELKLFEGNPLNNEDYVGYFRIKDNIEGGLFPIEELNLFKSEYMDTPENEKNNLLQKWWQIFAHDPKDISMADKNWVQSKFPKYFDALQVQMNMNLWNTAAKVSNTVMSPSSNTLVSLKPPKYPENLTSITLTKFNEELRVFKLAGGHWNRHMLSEVDKHFIRRLALGQQAAANFPLLKDWEDTDKVSDDLLFNSLATLLDSTGFHTSPFNQFLTATGTLRTIEYTSTNPLNLLLAERHALMSKLNLKADTLSKVEHQQLIKSFQNHVKLKGMSDDITEKVKQIVATALSDKDVNYFRFTDIYYTMVETCVNSLRQTTQAYSSGLLSNLFQKHG